MPKMDRTARWLKIARGLLSCPTAPLMEEAPIRHIRAFAAERPGLFVRQDRAGNLLLGYPKSAARSRAPLVLVAHLDHPGFWVQSVRGSRAKLLFKGGVGVAHARRGSGVRFFQRGEKKAIGRGKISTVQGQAGRLRSATARVLSGRADPAGFAMWDFPGFSRRGGKIITRGCDDLLGAAAALCVLDEAARAKTRCGPLWALFTRGEEIGFLGALWALRHRGLPPQARVLSLECSRALPVAPQGAGVVVRVGDRASVFDPALSEALWQAAEALRKKDRTFRSQRKLMDGGACEATVFCAAGLRSSGLALPLGNYHNQAGLDGGPKRIGAESVRVEDYLAEIHLLLELARMGRPLARAEHSMRARLRQWTRRAEQELRAHPLLDGTGSGKD